MEEAFEAFAALLIAVGPMAISTTKLVDFVRNLVGTRVTNKAVWNFAAFAVGSGIALLWQFNFVIPLLQAVPALAKHVSLMDGVGGQILTGIAIGAVASGWHEKFDQMSARAKVAKAAVPVAYDNP